MKTKILFFSIFLFSLNSFSQTKDGGLAGDPSIFRKGVPAEFIERISAAQYKHIVQQANQRGQLLPKSDSTAFRVRRIAEELLKQTARFNAQSTKWNWEFNAIRSPTINAFCMPGGKIIVYTGIVDKLNLTDDETAVVMGHEMGHALREHGREQMTKQILTSLAVGGIGVIWGNDWQKIGNFAANLLNLKFSRGDETDADLVGLELASRSGFDPRAGVTLWQKMSQASGSFRVEFLSTHPANGTRIETMQSHMNEALNLYREALKNKGRPQ